MKVVSKVVTGKSFMSLWREARLSVRSKARVSKKYQIASKRVAQPSKLKKADIEAQNIGCR